MASHKLVSFHFIQSLIILIFSTTLANSALNPFVSPHLSVRPPSWLVRRGADESPAATNFTEFTPYEYEQTIDHFTFRPESYLKFKQRYVINPKHWGGAKSKSPIFVYLGAEESVEEEVAVIGLLYENAHKFKAMLVFIEEEVARKYFQQLISAAGFCHARGVYHRDLKPENLLLDEIGDLKVSYFGINAISD